MKKFFKKAFRFALIAGIVFFITTNLWVITYKFVNPPFTFLMVKRYFAGELHKGKIRHSWIEFDKISKKMSQSVIASEDQKFLEHSGFDFDAIKNALANNKSNRRKTKKGGSTISQQTAKNVFLYPKRSYIRKGLEAYFTVLIEFYWSKERILEVYLNVIELGKGIFGVEQAAQIYFKKDAVKLNRYETALMAAVLPNPRRFSVWKPSKYIRRRQNWILRQMRNLGY